MFRILLNISFTLLLLQPAESKAQDLTGTWEGDLAGFEFLQVNIVQVKDTLCGYTWDTVYNKDDDYCKAFFKGYYDRAKNRYVFIGTSLFENSGGHVLMELILELFSSKDDKILEGWEDDPPSRRGIINFSFLTRQKVTLTRVSKKPAKMLPQMVDCVNEQKRLAKKPVKKITAPVKPPIRPVITQPKDTLKKLILPVKPDKPEPRDTIKKIKTPVIPPVKDSTPLVAQMNKRKNNEMKHLVVNEKNIILEVFDNGIIDQDTVSVFYNHKLLLSHKVLSEKAIKIPITLDEKVTTHEIVLFAENLGSIPPNTALVVVHAGDKRYELFASASLTENAVITFEYKPK